MIISPGVDQNNTSFTSTSIAPDCKPHHFVFAGFYVPKKRMLIPIRCFTCNKVLANLWNRYQELLKEGKSEAVALDTLLLKRICCRTIMLTHVDMLDRMLKYC